MQRVNVVSVAIFDGSHQHILLVKNENEGQPYWSLPGGYVEQNETLKEAAIREVMEETGYIITVEKLYGVREVLFTKRKHHAMIFTFTAKIVDGEGNSADPDQEILQVQWMDLTKANEVLSYLPEKLEWKDQLASYHFQTTDDF